MQTRIAEGTLTTTVWVWVVVKIPMGYPCPTLHGSIGLRNLRLGLGQPLLKDKVQIEVHDVDIRTRSSIPTGVMRSTPSNLMIVVSSVGRAPESLSGPSLVVPIQQNRVH